MARASKPLTISLPEKMAKAVKARVESGEYASESEVIREGLRALAVQEAAYGAALEHWVRTEGKKRVADYEADPSGGIPASEMRGRMREYMKKRRAAK